MKIEDKIFNTINLIFVFIITLGYIFNIKMLINIFFIALIFKLIIHIKYKTDQKIETINCKDNFKIIKAMALFCIGIWIASFFSMNISYSFAEAKNFTKWMMLPFLCACIIAYKLKKFENSVYMALVVGDFVILCNLFWNHFVLGIDRPGTYVFNHPNAVAGVIIFILPFLMFNKFFNIYVKVIIFAINIMAIFITESRGVIIALSVMCVFFMCSNKQVIIMTIKKNIAKSIMLISVILMSITMTLLFMPNNKLFHRFNQIIKYHDSMIINHVGGDRIVLWESSLQMIKDNPLGIGLKNFNKVYNEGGYVSVYARERWLESPHNIFLHIFVETGILGGILFILLLLCQVKWLWKYKDNQFALAYLYVIIGMCIHGLFDYNFLVRVYYQLYWFICGLIWINCNAKDEIHK